MPARKPKRSPRKRSPGELLTERVIRTRKRLQRQLPDIAPEDLDLILASLLRPPGIPRRFLVREIRPGVYVP